MCLLVTQVLSCVIGALFRYALRSDVRALGHKPSSEDKMKIQDRRESLQTRVEAFHQQGLQFMCVTNVLRGSPDVPRGRSRKSSPADRLTIKTVARWPGQ